MFQPGINLIENNDERYVLRLLVYKQPETNILPIRIKMRATLGEATVVANDVIHRLAFGCQTVVLHMASYSQFGGPAEIMEVNVSDEEGG